MNKPLIICDRVMYGGLLALIFFLPYSIMLISVCQAAMFLAWAANNILSSKESARGGAVQGFSFSFNSMAWPLIAIGLLIVLTVPLSHDPSLSFKKFFTRFLFQIISMWLVIKTVRSRKRLYTVLAVLLSTVFLANIDALLQYGWGHDIFHYGSLIFGRVSGSMHHPNDLATLIVTVLPMAFVLNMTFRERITRARIAMIALLFLILVVVLGLTASRGAWVAFAVSMLVLGLCLRSWKVMAGIVLMLIMFFWVFGTYCMNTRTDLYPTAQGSVLQFFSNPSDRGLYWDTAIGVIKHSPWFGCGYSTYMKTLGDLKASHIEYPHNSLLHITAELGLIGLALYSWLFIALCFQIKNVLRAVSRERDLLLLGFGISCGILAWMIHSLLDTPWSSLQLGILLWLMIGILLSFNSVLSNDKGEKSCQSF